MKQNNFEKIYKKAPYELKEEFKKFRKSHPQKTLKVGESIWNYILCGEGKETILLLTGGAGRGDSWFLHILELEKKYRVLSLTYPLIASRMEQLVNGIAEITQREGIDSFHVIGQSFGGIVAQCLAQKYPKKIRGLILSHTTTNSLMLNSEIREKKIKQLKKKNKIFSIIPFWLMRFIMKKKLAKIINPIGKESAFWKAYFMEIFQDKSSKQASHSLIKCMIDFAENYRFNKNDFEEVGKRAFIMESDTDKAFTPVEKKTLKELFPEAKIKVFLGTGHLSISVKREEFFIEFESFLRELN